jgi:O-antigen ligase
VLYTEIPYYALFYAITQENNILSERHIQSLLGIFIVTAIIGSCYGTVTVLLGLKERAESFTSGYYNFGSYLTASLTMVLILGRSTMFNRKRWVWYGLVLIMSVGLLLTLNRIHICIMILAFIIVGLVQERKLLLIMAVVIAVAILISPSIRQRLDQTIHFTEHLSDRDVIWKGASQIWSNHPYFGYGPHTFSKIFPFPNELQDKKINGWHNDYLQVYIESGVLCLLAMLWLIVNIYRQVFIYLRKYKNDRQKREIVISVMAGITTILLSSLTGSAFLDVLIRMMFGFLLAFLALLLRNKKPMNQMQ